MVGLGKGSGNTFNKSIVAVGKTFLNKCGIAADKVDSKLVCRPFQGFCKLGYVGRRTGRSKHTYGGYRNTAVNYGDSVLALYLIADRHKLFGITGYLIINLIAGLVNVAVNTA